MPWGPNTGPPTPGVALAVSGVEPGRGARAAKPSNPAIPRIVAGVIVNPVDTLVRNGSNLALSVPARPRHRSCVIESWNGNRSDEMVLVMVDICHPVRPESLACSKL